jgi:hypothetical protein
VEVKVVWHSRDFDKDDLADRQTKIGDQWAMIADLLEVEGFLDAADEAAANAQRYYHDASQLRLKAAEWKPEEYGL